MTSRSDPGRHTVVDEVGETRRDVWSERELLRLIDSLAREGHVTDETAEAARATLRSEGFEPALRALRTAGAFE
jgi:hypothetical protein